MVPHLSFQPSLIFDKFNSNILAVQLKCDISSSSPVVCSTGTKSTCLNSCGFDTLLVLLSFSLSLSLLLLSTVDCLSSSLSRNDFFLIES